MIDERKQYLLQEENWTPRGFEQIMAAPNRVGKIINYFINLRFANQQFNSAGRPFFKALRKQSMLSPKMPPPGPNSDNRKNLQTSNHTYQGPQYRGENPLKSESSWYPRTGCDRGKQEPMRADPKFDREGKEIDESIIPQSSYSNHPIVNGSMEFQNVCLRCDMAPIQIAQDIYIRRRKKFEKANLPEPFLNNDWPQSDEVEEISIEELIAIERASSIGKRCVDVVDGPLDGNCNKFNKEDVPNVSEKLFSVHLVERDGIKRTRTHHDIINGEDIEPLPEEPMGRYEFPSNRGKNRPRRRQVESFINTQIKNEPLDYMNILDKTKAEISLQDSAQIFPETRKHRKHGISRVNDNRSQRKRRQAEISEVALKSSIEETPRD
ncbi:hypothetical protein GcM3_061022 [Golovinomyces cichoracearum]|uniref:Uncharacterized protein n=1 Tax=Golovinomyces cichoracearum TaxID=62708 RepID=A0A420IVZ8_9PEZI|nr:hypothetical protein GcM3_061022 [Golovinomyces cichoracearum]